MKKEQLKEFDNSILENIETACLETDKEGCTVVNDKLQKTQKIKTQASGDQKRWI